MSGKQWFSDLADDAPSMDEALAIFAAVQAYRKKLHPRTRLLVGDLPDLLDEMARSAARVRAVTNRAPGARS